MSRTLLIIILGGVTAVVLSVLGAALVFGTRIPFVGQTILIGGIATN